MFTEGLLGAELHMRFWGFRDEEDPVPRDSHSNGENVHGGEPRGPNNWNMVKSKVQW